MTENTQLSYQLLYDLAPTQLELDSAVKEILANRTRMQLHEERLAKQKACAHDWSYDGHGHNSDWYVCRKCGLSKEE